MGRKISIDQDGNKSVQEWPGTREDVNMIRENLIGGGMTITVSPGRDVPVDTDDRSRANIHGMHSFALVRIAAGDLTTTTAFRGADNRTHNLTPLEVKALGEGVAARVAAIYEASWAIKDDPKGIVPEPVEDPRWPK